MCACIDAAHRLPAAASATQHPDDWSNWQASTLGIAYGWQDGKLSSHRYSWQKATEPQQQPPDGLARVAVSPVMPPARDR